MDQIGIAGFVERAVDGEQSLSLRDLFIKLYIRKWMFAICLIIPAIIGFAASMATPSIWVATTKILIRYSSTESVFLADLIPDNRPALSGAVISEILRSRPTLIETIRKYNIKEADLYQPPTAVIVTKLIGLLTHPVNPGLADADIARLAGTLQDSLEEASKNSSALGSKASPIQLLAADSTLPQAMKGDELITLTVRSFNRDKVAEITNGLANSLIDQYYRLSAEDAHRAYEFLSGLADSSAADVALLEQNPDAHVASAAVEQHGSGGATAAAQYSPAVARMADDLVALETQLDRFQQFYTDDSTRIQKTQAQIAEVKRQLAGQERLEVAKQVLQQIQAHRFQALNTEKLYRSRLVPISIVEPAVTPLQPTSSPVLRPVIGGITGLLIGGVLGLALVIMFGLFDQRLLTPGDVERAMSLPIFGWLPRQAALRGWRGRLPRKHRSLDPAAATGLLQVLARLDAAGPGRAGKLVAIASADDGEGKSLVALLIARALAQANSTKVLLVDADPLRASLSRHFGRQAGIGLVDAAVATRDLSDLVVNSGIANLDLVAAGSAAEREHMGFYLQRLRNLFDEARRAYDVVIVDTPSLALGSEAMMCCMAVDSVLVVVKSGATRATQARNVLRRLAEVSVRPRGVILNFRYSLVPSFIDRNI